MVTGALYRLDQHEAALIQWWRGPAEAGGNSLACRLRAIAANPTPLALCELPLIAISVAAYERQLDQIFQAAREDDYRARTVAALARLTEVAP